VRAALRGFYSSDIADLESYRPDDGENFQVAITAFIGPADGPGEEMFQFAVCSAKWLQENAAYVRRRPGKTPSAPSTPHNSDSTS
jgi:hypothetical protein